MTTLKETVHALEKMNGELDTLLRSVDAALMEAR